MSVQNDSFYQSNGMISMMLIAYLHKTFLCLYILAAPVDMYEWSVFGAIPDHCNSLQEHQFFG